MATAVRYVAYDFNCRLSRDGALLTYSVAFCTLLPAVYRLYTLQLCQHLTECACMFCLQLPPSAATLMDQGGGDVALTNATFESKMHCNAKQA